MKKPQPDRPVELTVSIKSGSVIVRELNWQAYKSFKSQVIQQVTEKLSPDAIVDIAAVMKSTDPFFTGVQAIKTLGLLVSDAIDELTPMLVKGCVSDPKLDVDALGPYDMLRLREACTKVNDLDQLIGLEGNALAAAVKRIKALTAGGGGSGSKQPLPPPTDGASLT